MKGLDIMKKTLIFLLSFVFLSGFTYTDIEKTVSEVANFLEIENNVEKKESVAMYDFITPIKYYKLGSAHIYFTSDEKEVQSIQFLGDKSLLIKVAEHIGIQLEDEKALMAFIISKDKCSDNYYKYSQNTVMTADKPYTDKNLFNVSLDFNPERFEPLLEIHTLHKMYNSCDIFEHL